MSIFFILKELKNNFSFSFSPFSHSNTLDYSIHGSAGILAPNMEAKIVNIETGESLPSGKENIGELCVRGPNVMLGYLNKPEATAATIEKDG